MLIAKCPYYQCPIVKQVKITSLCCEMESQGRKSWEGNHRLGSGMRPHERAAGWHGGERNNL
tara:strand:+ start:124 stop:309 length:186 start_codon:yes stop_codon:yes gene_type:complete